MEDHVAASAQLEHRVEVLEAMASASAGRQNMLAGNLTEVRDTVKGIERMVGRLEVSQRDARTWQKITDHRLDRIEEDVFDIKGNVEKLNKKYEGLSKKVGDLNTKYERLDQKVDGLDKRVEGLDQKVDLLGEDVGGVKAGQMELRDMVATLLARSEGVEQTKS
jgi:archaellum component FlaC